MRKRTEPRNSVEPGRQLMQRRKLHAVELIVEPVGWRLWPAALEMRPTKSFVPRARLRAELRKWRQRAQCRDNYTRVVPLGGFARMERRRCLGPADRSAGQRMKGSPDELPRVCPRPQGRHWRLDDRPSGPWTALNSLELRTVPQDRRAHVEPSLRLRHVATRARGRNNETMI